MGLPKAGVQLVADGSDVFIDSMGRAHDSLGRFVKLTESSSSSANKAFGGFSKGAAEAGGGISAFGTIATGALLKVGEVAVSALGSAAKAFGGFIAGSISGAGDFEANMNVFASVTGDALTQSGQSLQDFQQLFIQLGKELPVSTAEVQQAAIELAKGGIDPATIAAGGLRTSLNLAAAGGIGLAESATIMAKQLGVWVDATADAGEKAAFLQQTADLLAQAANATTSDVDELSLGLANVGGTAKIAGLSFRETVTGMALLAPGFSSAADAGTSFKTFLSRLIPTTKPAKRAMEELGLYSKETGSIFYDSQGSFIGLAKAAGILQSATANLSEEQKLQAFQAIFGQDAIRAAAILAEQGAEGYDRMTASLASAGSVQDQAAARQQGFNTALENAKGSIEALQIAVGTALLPLLTNLLNNVLTPGINIVSQFADGFIALVSKGDAFTFFTTLGGLIMPLNQRLGELVASFGLVSDPMEALTTAATTLVPPLGAILAGAQVLAPVFATLFAVLTGGSPAMSALTGTIATLSTLLGPQLAGVFMTTVSQIGTIFGQISGIVTSAIGAIQQGIQQSGPAIQQGFAAYQQAAAIVGTVFNSVLGVVSTVLAQVQGFITTYGAQAVAAFATTWASVQTTVTNVLGGLASIVQPLLANIQTFIQTHGADIQQTFATAWQQVNAIIQTAMAIINATVVPMLKGIGAFIASHGTEIQMLFHNTWVAISTIIGTVLGTIQGLLQTVLKAIQGDWSGAWETLKTTSANLVMGVMQVIAAGLANLQVIFGDALTRAKQAIDTAIGDFVKLGTNIVQGLIRGVQSQVGALGSAIKGIISSALGAGQAAAQTGSPSRLFADKLGTPIGQGMVLGVQRQGPALEQAVTGTISGALRPAQALIASTSTGAPPLGADLSQYLAKGVQASGGRVIDAVRSTVGSAISVGKSAGTSGAASIGDALAKGVAAGISRASGSISSALTGALSKGKSAAQNAFGIASPSEVMAKDVGEPVILGIVEGMQRLSGQIGAMARQLSKQLTDDLIQLAKDATDAFQEALTDGLKANVDLASVRLSNAKALTGLGGNARAAIEEQLGANEQDLIAADDDRRAELGDISRDILAAQQERDAALAEINASTDFEPNKAAKRAEVIAKANKKLDELRRKYDAARQEAEQKINALLAQRQQLQAALARAQQQDTDNAAIRRITQERLAVAEREALELAQRTGDAAAGARYFQERSQQILAQAQLQEEINAAVAAGDAAHAAELREQYGLLVAQEAAQLALFKATQQQQSPYAKVVEDLNTLRGKLLEELALDQRRADAATGARRAGLLAEVANDQAVLNQINSLFSLLGTSAADGIAGGVVDAGGNVAASLQQVLAQAIAAAQAALAIHSPSRVLAAAIGAPMMEGVGLGITRALASTQATFAGAMGAVAAPAMTTVRPPASASQIAQSTATSYDSSIGSIAIDARGSTLSKAAIRAAVDQALNARTARGYGIRATRAYG